MPQLARLLVTREHGAGSDGKYTRCPSGISRGYPGICPGPGCARNRNSRIKMPKLPGINHLEAVHALEKAGFRIIRQGRRHIVLSNGGRFVTVPRNNPIVSVHPLPPTPSHEGRGSSVTHYFTRLPPPWWGRAGERGVNGYVTSSRVRGAARATAPASRSRSPGTSAS